MSSSNLNSSSSSETINSQGKKVKKKINNLGFSFYNRTPSSLSGSPTNSNSSTSTNYSSVEQNQIVLPVTNNRSISSFESAKSLMNNNHQNLHEKIKNIEDFIKNKTAKYDNKFNYISKRLNACCVKRRTNKNYKKKRRRRMSRRRMGKVNNNN